ncbi:MAG: hypothetical protein H0V12_00830 [Chloroflexi bacterium]|nr:hypothetical protein [Chloroflexota bacterium]
MDGQSYEFTGGRCLLDETQDTLAVQVGEPGAREYFGMAVNDYPRRLRSGVSYRTEMTVIRRGRTLPVHSVRVTLADDLRGGAIVGAQREDVEIAGSFSC